MEETGKIEPIRFEQRALIELFGHNRIAGLVSEQTLGGGAFVRVDVPAVNGDHGYTKLFGNGAIYGMTFVTEAVARAAVGAYCSKPVSEYDIPALRRLSSHAQGDEDEDGFRDR